MGRVTGYGRDTSVSRVSKNDHACTRNALRIVNTTYISCEARKHMCLANERLPSRWPGRNIVHGYQVSMRGVRV